MDLMGDIGAADQLISAREENKVLRAKVEELKEKVKDLTLTNATLLAEVEMYRKEATLPSFSNLALGATGDSAMKDSTEAATVHDFVASGNGSFPSDPAVSLANLHGFANPLCCALDASDTVLATGGADSTVTLTAWGAALAPNEDASSLAVQKTTRVELPAPVICISFSQTDSILAAGCMDGSVHLIHYKLVFGGKVEAALLKMSQTQNQIKYTKYVKALAWSPSHNILASSSADGTVQLSQIILPLDENDDDEVMDLEENCDSKNMSEVTVEQMKSLHMTGAVEALCFVTNGDVLCLYERETSVLTYFDLKDNFNATTHSLNGSVTGGFDSHVSFAVMQLSLSPNGKYLCAATDASRNIIIEVGTNNILRNLYGHKNDGFSQPRIAWSNSGQYIFGNTQEDSGVCVWDVASTKLVKRLQGHQGQLRDIFSSRKSDTVVTASYDKNVKVWLNEM